VLKVEQDALPGVQPWVQGVPRLLSSGETEAWLMVEVVRRVGNHVLVAGWCTGEARLGLEHAGEAVALREFSFARPDVSEHFGLAPDRTPGFALLAEMEGDAMPALCWSLVEGGSEGPHPLVAGSFGDAEDGLRALGPLEGLLAYCQEPFSPEWQRLVAKLPLVHGNCPEARAHIDAAHAFKGTAAFVLAGWAAALPGTLLWVEDEWGRCYPVDGGIRSPRQDVHDAFGSDLGVAALQSGLLLTGDGGDGRMVHTLSVKALNGASVHLLAQTSVVVQGNEPVQAARVLFGIGPLNDAWPERVERVDLPLLEALIAKAHAGWADLPVLVRECGQLPSRPAASIIVPLYGRSDFVESQMLEWARDPWIRANAELVYVVDDPALVEPFRRQAEELHRLYGVPFRWVWGGVNRGFSGANNLGAAHAHGEYLLFLNSYVFPNRPGWLQPMIEALRTRPQVGAVAPRLLFAEGGIQHAGMRFERLEEYGVWINRHPNMGLDPSLDPNTAATAVPAVTGACLLVRRTDFDRVGQWDTGYLIGDFEDSDLCLKLRQAGLQSLYLPEVELTHLERQSIVGLGAGDFRTRVTLWNAVRHQLRWRQWMEQDAANPVVQA